MVSNFELRPVRVNIVLIFNEKTLHFSSVRIGFTTLISEGRAAKRRFIRMLSINSRLASLECFNLKTRCKVAFFKYLFSLLITNKIFLTNVDILIS